MNRTRLNLISIAAMFLITFSLVSCDDFFGTEDLKAIIKEDVGIATAPIVIVDLMIPEKTSMGTPSPIGKQSFKVGVPYTITTTVGDDYTFSTWTCTGSSDDYSFENSSAATTTFTLINSVENLAIQPTFDRRPFVLKKEPGSEQIDVVLNKAITVKFSETMNIDSMKMGDIINIITWDDNDINSTPTNINSRFILSTTDSSFTLTPDTFYDIYYSVQITLSGEIEDSSNNAMGNDYTWYFTTGFTTDDDAPIIRSLAISPVDGNEYRVPALPAEPTTTEAANSVLYTNTTNILIEAEATDSSTVKFLTIKEVPEKGDVTSEKFSYTNALTYPLKSAITDGPITIVVIAEDGIGNESSSAILEANSRQIYIDTTAPSVIGFEISENADFTNSYVPVATYSSAVDAGAGIAGYAITTTDATPSTWIEATSLPTTLSTLIGSGSGTGAEDGTKTVYLHVKDKLGKTGYVRDTIILDQTKPSIASITLAGGVEYTSDGTVSVAATSISDSGSEIVGYALTTSATIPDTWITSLPLTVDLATGDGEKAIYLHIKDGAGNTNVASDLINLDTTPPIIAPITLNLSYTNLPAASFTGGLATDGDIGSAGIEYAVSESTTTPSSGWNASPPASITLSAGDGEKIVYLHARDMLGNSAYITDTIIYDTTLPAVTLSTTHPDTLVRDADIVRITATFTDANSIVETPKPTITIGTLVDITDMTKTSNTEWYYDWNVPAGNDGDVTISINAQDVAGNDNAIATGATSFRIDNAAPQLNISSIESNHSGYGAWATNSDIITLTFTASDAHLNSTGSVMIAGVTNAMATIANGSASTTTYTLTSGNLVVDGTASYSVTVTDTAGNSTTKSTGVSTNLTIDRTGPTLATTSFLSNNAVNTLAKSGDTASLIFTTVDNVGGVGIASIPVTTVTVGGAVSNGTLTQPSTLGSPYTTSYVTAASDTDGLISYAVNATDALGNPATPLTGTGITFDKTNPEATFTSLTSSTGSYARVGSIITLTYAASDTGGSDLADTSTNAQIAGHPVTATLSGSNYTATYTMVAGDSEGAIAYIIGSTDNAGNTSTSSGSGLIFDKTPPLPVVSTPTAQAPEATLNLDGTVTITWKNETDLTRTAVLLTWEKAAEVTGSIILGPAVETYTTPVLTNGVVYTFTLKTIDAAGNQSTGISATATPSASALTLSDISIESGPILTYIATFTDGTLNTLYYWAGNTTKPAGALSSTDVDGSLDLSTLLGGNKTFGFCLSGTKSSTTYESISYVFTWNGSSYSAATSRSLSSPTRTVTARTVSTTPSTLTSPIFRSPRSTRSLFTLPTATDTQPLPASWIASVATQQTRVIGLGKTTTKATAISSTQAEADQAKAPVSAGSAASTELIATPVSASVAAKETGLSIQQKSDLDQVSSSDEMAGDSEITVSYSIPDGAHSGSGTAPEAPAVPRRNGSGKTPFAMLVPAKATGKPEDEEVVES